VWRTTAWLGPKGAAARTRLGWWIVRPLYACLDALPLLQAAAKVRVADVAGFLDRHGVHTEAEPCVDADRSVGDELILAAEQRGADLIVAGAYGHTRLREWVFGGVTADLLTRSPKCCFIAH
jgi:nucleotide-binding universal stress UspA family protein